MKKLIFTFVLCSTVLSLMASSFKVQIDGKDINGQNIRIYSPIDEKHEYIKVYPVITNPGSAEIFLNGKKSTLLNKSDFEITWCGWGSCFSSDEMENKELEAGANTGEEFYIQATPPVTYEPKDGDSIVVYLHLYLASDPADSVSATITIIVGEKPISIESSKTTTVNVRVYPNPASDRVQFSIENLNLSAKTQIVIRSINGALVKKQDVTGLSQTNISLQGMNSGLYFYSVEQNGQALSVGKLVVK